MLRVLEAGLSLNNFNRNLHMSQGGRPLMMHRINDSVMMNLALRVPGKASIRTYFARTTFIATLWLPTAARSGARSMISQLTRTEDR